MFFTFLFRTFSIVLDFVRFHSEVCHLKEILRKNAFPIKQIDSCIKSLFNKRLTKKPVTLTAEKKDLVIAFSLFLQFKDKMPYSLLSIVVQKFSCGRSNAAYYGETCRHLSVRFGEHSVVLALPGKKSRSKKFIALKYHMLFCDQFLY